MYRLVVSALLLTSLTAFVAQADVGDFGLRLPARAVPDRVSRMQRIEPGKPITYAEFDGPGCLRHLFVVPNTKKAPLADRHIIVRIYFDGAEIPHVEAPLGDFFGVMHGLGWYPINTPFLSVKERTGYNCYFEMPFAKSARIEFESTVSTWLYLQADWHRYPDQKLEEPRRFCARWRREMPTQRYGENFFMLDADGPGQLVGFVYGVRLIDQTDRWSHGGSDNIYIDGEGDHPAYIRGIGGEDTFGVGYGGALHTPETHLYSGIPYYTHEDVGEARPAQRVVGYRFFVKDAIPFEKSIHMRFGCMENDICATVYWYQEGTPRPYAKLPDGPQRLPGVELPRGSVDLPLPDSGQWTLRGPLPNQKGEAITAAIKSKSKGDDNSTAGHSYRALHGFVDFSHVFRPNTLGVGVFHDGMAGQARCTLEVTEDTDAELTLTWDDRLVVQLNDEKPIDMGQHDAFRSKAVPVKLRKGKNTVLLTLSNTVGSNHGGWVYCFRAKSTAGTELKPAAMD